MSARARGSSGFMGKGKVTRFKETPRKKDPLVMHPGF